MAQLGARFHGMEEVDGSNPSRSTNRLQIEGAAEGLQQLKRHGPAGFMNLRGTNVSQWTLQTAPGTASSRAVAMAPTCGSIVGQ